MEARRLRDKKEAGNAVYFTLRHRGIARWLVWVVVAHAFRERRALVPRLALPYLSNVVSLVPTALQILHWRGFDIATTRCVPEPSCTVQPPGYCASDAPRPTLVTQCSSLFVTTDTIARITATLFRRRMRVRNPTQRTTATSTLGIAIHGQAFNDRCLYESRLSNILGILPGCLPETPSLLTIDNLTSIYKSCCESYTFAGPERLSV